MGDGHGQVFRVCGGVVAKVGGKGLAGCVVCVAVHKVNQTTPCLTTTNHATQRGKRDLGGRTHMDVVVLLLS